MRSYGKNQPGVLITLAVGALTPMGFGRSGGLLERVREGMEMTMLYARQMLAAYRQRLREALEEVERVRTQWPWSSRGAYLRVLCLYKL